MCCDSCFFVTADKEAAVTRHESTHATSTPAHEQKKRHRDCFDSTHRTYVSLSVTPLHGGCLYCKCCNFSSQQQKRRKECSCCIIGSGYSQLLSQYSKSKIRYDFSTLHLNFFKHNSWGSSRKLEWGAVFQYWKTEFKFCQMGIHTPPTKKKFASGER